MTKKKLSTIINAVAYYLLIISILILTISVLYYRFRFSGTGYLSAFEDDFFYYLKVAENIYRHNFSSFNNIYPTNGYQPLWFMIILGLLYICKGPGIPFFVMIMTVVFVSLVVIFYVSLKLLSRFIENRLLTCALAAFTTFLSLLLSFGAMEVHLAILLMLLIIQFLLNNVENLDNPSVMLKLGFLSSLLMLSRLDSFLFIFLFLLGLAATKCSTIWQYLKRMGFFSIGGILVPAYLLFNIINFGTLMPVSGMAKQLKTAYFPSAQYLTTMWILAKGNMYTQAFMSTTIPMTIIGLIAGIIRYIRNIDRAVLRILIPCQIFPLLFLAMHSILSDFGIWAWYLYPWIISFVTGCIIMYGALQRLIVRLPVYYALIIACAAIFFFVDLNVKFLSGSKPEANMMYEAGTRISSFLKNDPRSVVAIGDRGGIVSYLLPNPVIQLEGLVMDREFLNHIRNQDNLLHVLKKYNVRYYITHNPPVDKSGCYLVHEPYQGGRYTKKMPGVLCQAPVLKFTLNNIDTVMFRLNF